MVLKSCMTFASPDEHRAAFWAVKFDALVVWHYVPVTTTAYWKSQ
jgi:hypothetical protein